MLLLTRRLVSLVLSEGTGEFAWVDTLPGILSKFFVEKTHAGLCCYTVVSSLIDTGRHVSCRNDQLVSLERQCSWIGPVV